MSKQRKRKRQQSNISWVRTILTTLNIIIRVHLASALMAGERKKLMEGHYCLRGEDQRGIAIRKGRTICVLHILLYSLWFLKEIAPTLLPKEALEKVKKDAKMLKTSILPPLRKGHAVEAIASSQFSGIWLKSLLCKHATDMKVLGVTFFWKNVVSEEGLAPFSNRDPPENSLSNLWTTQCLVAFKLLPFSKGGLSS